MMFPTAYPDPAIYTLDTIEAEEGLVPLYGIGTAALLFLKFDVGGEHLMVKRFFRDRVKPQNVEATFIPLWVWVLLKLTREEDLNKGTPANAAWVKVFRHFFVREEKQRALLVLYDGGKVQHDRGGPATPAPELLSWVVEVVSDAA